MARLLFHKTGNALWISHLDLMRLFQRAFKRAGYHLKHTQGYNPRPSVSIALPLSVGIESECELLDFEIEDQLPPLEELKEKLNCALVSGIQVISISHGSRKLRDLTHLLCRVDLEYDKGAGEDTVQKIKALFEAESLIVSKKSKKGPVEQDIIPMIKHLQVSLADQNTVSIHAMICCQNPSMNPMQIVGALENYLPQYMPDHATCHRLEIYDAEENIFR